MASAVEFNEDVFKEQLQYVVDLILAMDNVKCPNKTCKSNIIKLVVQEQSKFIHDLVKENVDKLLIKQSELKPKSTFMSREPIPIDVCATGSRQDMSQYSSLRQQRKGGMQTPVTMEGAKERIVIRKGDYDVEEVEFVDFADALIDALGEDKVLQMVQDYKKKHGELKATTETDGITVEDAEKVIEEFARNNPHLNIDFNKANQDIPQQGLDKKKAKKKAKKKTKKKVKKKAKKKTKKKVKKKAKKKKATKKKVTKKTKKKKANLLLRKSRLI